MQRANDALDSWGIAGQKEWYLRVFYAADETSIQNASVIGAIGAAKGRALHLGGVYALWNEIDAYCAAHKIETAHKIEAIRNQLGTACNSISRFQLQNPAFKPLTKPASY